MIPRLDPKLSEKHIKLPPFSPMRVCLAAQVLSNSVSKGILTHVALNDMPPAATFTADFIEKMDCLFNIFNSTQLSDAMIFKRALTDSSPAWEFLEKMTSYLKNLVFQNQRKISPLCVKGWIQNISALKLLWNDLKINYNFKFLLTRRLTQDFLENLFSILRSKNGNNNTPDCSKFRSAIKETMCNQMLSPSEESNCEIDLAQFLITRDDIKKCSLELKLVESFDINYNICNSTNLSDLEISAVQENAIEYFTGWACSKLSHETCKLNLASFDETFNQESIYLSFKKYDDAKFLFPTKYGQHIVSRIYEVFTSKFKIFLAESYSNVKQKLIHELGMPQNDKICKDCYQILATKMINGLINCYIHQLNDKCLSSKFKENKKAKKLLHR